MKQAITPAELFGLFLDSKKQSAFTGGKAKPLADIGKEFYRQPIKNYLASRK